LFDARAVADAAAARSAGLRVWVVGGLCPPQAHRVMHGSPRNHGCDTAGTGVLSCDWPWGWCSGCLWWKAPVVAGWAVKTDHWFYGLFQSVPDLITLLLPGVSAASLGPDASGDAIYRFEAPELKTVNHRLDGALWPRGSESGTPEQPVVLLEVQMQGKPGFKHRLWAQTARFAQLHPGVQHLEVVVVVPQPGFYFGASYVSYALTTAIAIAVFVVLLPFFSWEEEWIYFSAIGGSLLLSFPIVFRLSRSIWINLFFKYKSPEERAKGEDADFPDLRKR